MLTHAHRIPRKSSTPAGKLRPWGAAVALIACLLFQACGAGQQRAAGPSETLRAYAESLQEGRIDEAYSMLSDEAKREVSLDAFRRMVRENPGEIREIAKALSRRADPPQVTATIRTPNGEALLLVYESGRWKIDSSVIDLYAQLTPRQAVAAFIRAFDRRRYDVLMRFVPDAKKTGLDAKTLKKAWGGDRREEVERIVQALKSALPTATFEEVGDRATMPFGAAGTVQLVREHGVWKIEDFD